LGQFGVHPNGTTLQHTLRGFSSPEQVLNSRRKETGRRKAKATQIARSGNDFQGHSQFFAFSISRTITATRFGAHPAS
jgi:hypothetical protein